MRYDIIQGQFKQADAVKYNRKVINRMTITVDTMSVTALSVVIRYWLEQTGVSVKSDRFYMNIWNDVILGFIILTFTFSVKKRVGFKLELFIYELPTLITWITDSTDSPAVTFSVLFFARHLFNKESLHFYSNESGNYFYLKSFFFLNLPLDKLLWLHIARPQVVQGWHGFLWEHCLLPAVCK